MNGSHLIANIQQHAILRTRGDMLQHDDSTGALVPLEVHLCITSALKVVRHQGRHIPAEDNGECGEQMNSFYATKNCHLALKSCICVLVQSCLKYHCIIR